MTARLLSSARFWTVAGAVLAADWLTKWAANALLVPGRPIPVLGSLVRLTLAYDPRTSLFLGVPGTPHVAQPTGLTGILAARLLIALGVLWLAARAPRAYALGLGAVLAALVGNSVDRLVWGTVVNFVDLGVGPHRWPTFNLADVAVLSGWVLVALRAQRERRAERDTLGLRSLRQLPSALPASLRR